MEKKNPIAPGMTGWAIKSQIWLLFLVVVELFFIGYFAILGLLGELTVKAIFNACSSLPTMKRFQ